MSAVYTHDEGEPIAFEGGEDTYTLSPTSYIAPSVPYAHVLFPPLVDPATPLSQLPIINVYIYILPTPAPPATVSYIYILSDALSIYHTCICTQTQRAGRKTSPARWLARTGMCVAMGGREKENARARDTIWRRPISLVRRRSCTAAHIHCTRVLRVRLGRRRIRRQ